MSVRDDATPSLRLEVLIPKMEEFHSQAELFKVIHFIIPWRSFLIFHFITFSHVKGQ